jgi:hypothetical protein
METRDKRLEKLILGDDSRLRDMFNSHKEHVQDYHAFVDVLSSFTKDKTDDIGLGKTDSSSDSEQY